MTTLLLQTDRRAPEDWEGASPAPHDWLVDGCGGTYVVTSLDGALTIPDARDLLYLPDLDGRLVNYLALDLVVTGPAPAVAWPTLRVTVRARRAGKSILASIDDFVPNAPTVDGSATIVVLDRGPVSCGSYLVEIAFKLPGPLAAARLDVQLQASTGYLHGGGLVVRPGSGTEGVTAIY